MLVSFTDLVFAVTGKLISPLGEESKRLIAFFESHLSLLQGSVSFHDIGSDSERDVSVFSKNGLGKVRVSPCLLFKDLTRKTGFLEPLSRKNRLIMLVSRHL